LALKFRRCQGSWVCAMWDMQTALKELADKWVYLDLDDKTGQDRYGR
jgi:hypothetical protein